jgi:hypothetical protein
VPGAADEQMQQTCIGTERNLCRSPETELKMHWKKAVRHSAGRPCGAHRVVDLSRLPQFRGGRGDARLPIF